jgi:ATP-dependent Clp protease ATP-binding subunit ClpA
LGAINDFFTIKIERPEIKNRIGENFIVFDYISYEAARQIASKQVYAIRENLKTQKNIDFSISPAAAKQLAYEFRKDEHISQGGRGVGNVIENMLIRPISDYLVKQKIWGDASINVTGFELVNGNWRIICDD